MRDFTAARLRDVQESATIAVSDKAKALKAQGKDVLDLSGGDPHFKTPEHIRREAFEAMERGDTRYPPSRGVPRLLEAIQRKLAQENGLEYARDELVVTPGGKLGIYASLMATVEPGDQVLLLSPAWVSYEPGIRLAGGSPVYVPLEPEEYRITPEALRSVDAPRAKVLIFNSPNNPTGRVATREELEAVSEFARERDLLVISDELYEKLLYDGHEHTSLATLPGMWERTITVNGFSKAYAMTGWRLGYVAAPREIIAQLFKVHQQSVTAAATFTQLAGARALEGPQDEVDDMLREYDSNRRLVVQALNDMPGVYCPSPEGAFYAFPRIESASDSVRFAQELLEDALVAVTPGVAFGPTGEGHVRISFATSADVLERAFERMAKVLNDRVPSLPR
ncbi:MAG: pyridoxal phosphate-dependent aminotransferase [Chloroflexota bacterium]|nr:pyridoxal phosphate-dependent aminotransferase [Chloroflexota bacterium]